MTETLAALNRAARRRAAEDGLGAFTVEQVCDEVGVSRRTFFNYFASKEDAVLGVWVREDHSEAEERFVAGRGALVEDLAELMVARWELTGLTPDDTRELIAALQREPRLLARLLELGASRAQRDTALVERREAMRPGDVRAEVLVQMLDTLLRCSVQELLGPDTAHSVREAFVARLIAVREVLSA